MVYNLISYHWQVSRFSILRTFFLPPFISTRSTGFWRVPIYRSITYWSLQLTYSCAFPRCSNKTSLILKCFCTYKLDVHRFSYILKLFVLLKSFWTCEPANAKETASKRQWTNHLKASWSFSGTKALHFVPFARGCLRQLRDFQLHSEAWHLISKFGFLSLLIREELQ